MEVHNPPLVRSRWSLLAGVLVGLGTQLLFAYTAFCLFFFLKDGGSPGHAFEPIWNSLLAFQFAVSHSLLLWPPVSKTLQKWIPKAFYGSFYCIVTCLSLLLLFNYWTVSSFAIWSLTGTADQLVRLLFYLSWGGLIYSLSLTGLGYQTGLTQWWSWLRNRSLPRRGVPSRGAYQWMRHPVYLSFLGLIWFTPRMTLDHVVLTIIWTIYLGVGSYLKDERLAFYLGESYREYQRKVPAFLRLGRGLRGRGFPKEESAEGQSVIWQTEATAPPQVKEAA